MIYCVEDDASIRDIEVYALRSAGFEAKGFEDGAAFLTALETEPVPELTVLDIMLPGTDGLTLLHKMRETPKYAGIPVIMATAKGTEFDKIEGLDGGADYYLAKPFGVMEFLSCVKAVLRRCRKSDSASVLKDGELTLDPESRTAALSGERLTLTFKEFELLRLFLSHPGRVFTREALMESVWDTDYLGETRTVDMHIRTLRQKLGSYGERIETVRGVGYRYEAKA